jgi:hypothetical protein
MNDAGRSRTYKTTCIAKDCQCVGREGMQYIDDGSEPLEQFGIAVPEFIKPLGLFLEYIKNRIGAVAVINLVSEWVVAEIFPSLLGVLD